MEQNAQPERLEASQPVLEDEAAREKRFRALVQEGLDDLAAGRAVEVHDIGAWLEELARRRT